MSERATLSRAKMLLDLGRHREAIRLLQPLLAENPWDTEVLIMLGRAHAIAEDSPRMLEVANALVRVEPAGFFGHLLAAEALFAQKAYPQALEAARTAVTCSPDLSACHRMLAWCAGEVPGQERLAWDAAGQSVVLDPLDPDSHCCMGTVAMEQGRRDVAERALLEALRLDPGHAMARHNLGVLRHREGRLAEAAQNLVSVAAADPAARLAPRMLTVIVLVWLQRIHWALWILLLVGSMIGYDPADGFSPAAAAVTAIGVALGVWWTRRTVLALGDHARAVMWRVLNRSTATRIWFWSLVLAAAALLGRGVAPSWPARSAAGAISLIALGVGWTASWIGAISRRTKKTV